MKLLLTALVVCLVLGCRKEHKQEVRGPASQTPTRRSAQPGESNKFFVLTKWSTTDQKKAVNHLTVQKRQLFDLWRENIIDNVYYQPDVQLKTGMPMSLTAFVINGRTEGDVRRALRTTDVIRSNLATYTIIPVGNKVFGRNANALKLATTENTYAVIWAFLVEKDKLNSAALNEQEVVNEQLHEKGILENAYINLKMFSVDSSRTQPAIFFVNAKNEQEAKTFLDKMPVVIANQATYSLHSVGKLLLGTQD